MQSFGVGRLLVLLIFLTSAAAFSGPLDSRNKAYDFSSTAVFGLRTFLKQSVVGKLKKPSHSREAVVLDQHSAATRNVTDTSQIAYDSVEGNAEKLSNGSLTGDDEEEVPMPSTTVTAENEILVNFTAETVYTLPPVNRELSELEIEFRGWLQEFTKYSARDVLCLKDYRTRVLFEGIIASADESLVYRAFEVLFEDLYPLRVAGRIVARKLIKAIEASIQEQGNEVESVVNATGLSQEAVEEARLSFLAVAVPINEESYLTMEQLEKTQLADTVVETLKFDEPRSFLERIETKVPGRFGFSELIIGLHSCAEEVCALEACNAADTIYQVVLDLVQRPPEIRIEKDSKRYQYLKRYDDMVLAFRDWEGSFSRPSAETLGRRQARILDVVQGCFRGAENESVVNSLRILYADYTGLRLAGDVIFGIVSKFMRKRKKQTKPTNDRTRGA